MAVYKLSTSLFRSEENVDTRHELQTKDSQFKSVLQRTDKVKLNRKRYLNRV